MKTLRLLLWLRWKLFLRSSSTGNRIAAAAFTLLLLLAFSPAWVGGAFAAWAGVRRAGAGVIPIAFGTCQLAWLSLGILSGALGRTFDLDRFLRYPVRPRVVFGINIVASLLGPVPLMMLPTLVAVAVAAGQRAGAGAALGAALGGAFAMLVTAALLQVLLALFDEVLRHESVRFVATFLLTLLLVGLQVGTRLATRWLSEHAVLRLAHHEITLQQAVAILRGALERVPTVAAPSWVATGALEGDGPRLALGLLGSLAMLALAVACGAALMRHTVRGGDSAGGGRAPRHGRGERGGFGLLGGALPGDLGLLLRYELLTTLRTPQRLMSLIAAPLVGVVFFFNGHGRVEVGAGFVLLMLAMSIASASLLLFAYDGPGVRSFYLMPCTPRHVLMAKHAELLLRLAAQFVLAFGALSLLAHHLWTPLLFTALVADLAVILGALAAGSTVAMRQPTRARRRGISGRGGGNTWLGSAVTLGVFAAAAGVGGLVWLVRRLAGPPWSDAAGLVTAGLVLATAGAIWWRSLELNARVFLECREKLIEVLAHASED